MIESQKVKQRAERLSSIVSFRDFSRFFSNQVEGKLKSLFVL